MNENGVIVIFVFSCLVSIGLTIRIRVIVCNNVSVPVVLNLGNLFHLDVRSVVNGLGATRDFGIELDLDLLVLISIIGTLLLDAKELGIDGGRIEDFSFGVRLRTQIGVGHLLGVKRWEDRDVRLLLAG